MGFRGGLALFRCTSPVRGTGAAFAVIALLIQIWLPWHLGINALAEQSTSARTAAAFFGGDFAMCLAQHLRAQDSSGAPIRDPSHKQPPCPICQALHMLASLVPPANAVLLGGPPLGKPGITAVPAPLMIRMFGSTPQPRAPPDPA